MRRFGLRRFSIYLLFFLLAYPVTSALGATPTPGSDADFKRWIVRVRGIYVNPQESSSSIRPDLLTSKLGVSDDTVPEVDITYMLTKHLGLELIAAYTENDLVGNGGISGLGVVGRTKLLPPTLTLQCHPFPDSKIRPYVGVGVNYTLFFDERSTPSLEGTLGKTSINLDPSWGIAFQGGVDIELGKGWFLNFDLKYIDIDTDGTLKSGATKRRVDVDIDPLIIGVGIGFRF
ncbi:MAG: outer membrane beta-barrel protein [bacterium]|nr:outer membrane beta-barrel protein [bacterium]